VHNQARRFERPQRVPARLRGELDHELGLAKMMPSTSKTARRRVRIAF
jgi:hypothetical protein